jgi:hypothetical protein
MMVIISKCAVESCIAMSQWHIVKMYMQADGGMELRL